MPAFAFHGLCYASSKDALVAFNNSFPLMGESGLSFLVSSSVTDDGVVSYSLNTRKLSDASPVVFSGSLSLFPCFQPDVPYDYVGAGALWSFFFSFTLLCWLVAKNIGLVVNFFLRY